MQCCVSSPVPYTQFFHVIFLFQVVRVDVSLGSVRAFSAVLRENRQLARSLLTLSVGNSQFIPPLPLDGQCLHVLQSPCRGLSSWSMLLSTLPPILRSK